MKARCREPRSSPRNQDHIGLGAIHTLPHDALGSPVVFAAAPSNESARSSLALMLLRSLERFDPRRGAPPDEKALTLRKSALGAPCLFLGDKQGPSLSFSYGGGQLWAAICGKRRVGIDVAYPEEFAGHYPFARAFSPKELDWAGVLCHKDTARGAALIWSAKEAAVKAIGAGFNLFDPLDVTVGTPLFREQGILMEVRADRRITAWARTEGKGWLSVALG
ncbi:MAG: 4'-phosphopantetheinyl transferase superfamily protein [Deltaproteobacteria bacterium]|nr:4'-phosphopantetheinyl transferase superfamily protein [Deltaproteobacteria bacterium]MBW2284371.1 4'-phosphopantetheinyl transferase superfamily protein [Deltaproteobacteria bacterium]